MFANSNIIRTYRQHIGIAARNSEACTRYANIRYIYVRVSFVMLANSVTAAINETD